MFLQSSVPSLLFAACCLSITQNAVQGADPGERSKEACKQYQHYVPKSYECPFLKKSLFLGNEFAKEEEFPHVVILGYKNEDADALRWACTAALISDQYILTAAHCLTTSIYGGPIAARIGVTNLSDTDHLQEIKVAEIIPHPEHNARSFDNNIGLVKLEKKVNIGVRARPACLFTEKDIGTQEVINTAWGSTEFGGEFNDKLQKVVLEPYDLESCNKTYFGRSSRLNNGIDYDTMVCAGTKTIETYQPQSGGPLVIVHKEGGNPTCTYDIVGVASFGKPTIKADIPSVYTRVSAYIKWIEDTVWK